MIPEAFLFTYAGSSKDVIRLNYIPNPIFQPPSREARVFHELQGELWVDATQGRLVRMRGELIGNVKFAGGLLGYLQKGGHFDVQQQEISPGHWELTSLDVQIQGKALLMKTISIQQKERRTNFRAVPDTLTMWEVADLLAKQIIVAANHPKSARSHETEQTEENLAAAQKTSRKLMKRLVLRIEMESRRISYAIRSC